MSCRDEIARTRDERRVLLEATPVPTQGFTQLSNAVRAVGTLGLKGR